MAEDKEMCVGYFNGLQSCCLRADAAALLPKVKIVHHWKQSVPDEERGAAVVELEDGTFACLVEWQDYTGHGCQCDCYVEGPYQSYKDAVNLGLGDAEREVLGLQVIA